MASLQKLRCRDHTGAKRKYFLTSAQGLLRNVIYFTIPFEGLDHHPRVSKQKKVEFDRLVLSPPPALPLYRGRDGRVGADGNYFWALAT